MGTNKEAKILVYHTPKNAISDAILKGVFQFQPTEKTWNILTVWTGDIDCIESIKPDAAIVQCVSEDEREIFDKLDFPVVEVAREIEADFLTSVQIDDEEVGRMAADYYLSKGFQQLACVVELDRAFMEARLRGFENRAAEEGVSVQVFKFAKKSKEQFLVPPSNLLSSWLMELTSPIGLFAASDSLGVTIIRACKCSGIEIPGEVSVLGVSNNTSLCHLDEIELSSIKVPGEKIGYYAAKIIDDLLTKKNTENEKVLLKPIEIVNRKSTDAWSVNDEMVLEALSFIKNNFQNPINATSVVRVVEISRSGLERRFRNELGRSILEVLFLFRINEAKRLLLNTDQTILMISKGIGFNNPRQFSTAFERIVGEKPSVFRQNRI